MNFNLIHSFVNIFAGGRSDIKTWLFVLYLLILVILYIIFKNKPKKTIPWKYFGFGLIAMYLYGFILQVVYVAVNRLPFWSFFVTGGHSGISSSSFNHTHVAKASIAVVLSYFDHAQFNSTDAGSAFLGRFPDWVFLFGSLLLIILIGASFLYFTTSFRSILKNKNRRQKIFLIFGYALTSFSVIKTSIDGGLLHPALWINLIFIWLFIKKEKKNHYRFIYLGLSGSGLLLALIGRFSNFPYFYLTPYIIEQSGALVLLYTAILYNSERKIKLSLSVLTVLLLIIGYLPVVRGDVEFYKKYANLTIRPGQSVYYYNNQQRIVQKIIVDHPETINQLANRLNKYIYYYPLTVPGVTCRKGKLEPDLYATLISSKYFSQNIFPPNLFIKIANEPSIWVKGRWQTKLSISTDSCLPHKAAAIDGELKKNGLIDYILLNLSYVNFNTD